MRYLLLLTSLLLALPVHAVDEAKYNERRGIKDRVFISIGGFQPNFETTAQLDSETLGAGTLFSFEDDLALESDTFVARLDGYFRFGRKHRLEFGYVDLSRNGSAALVQQIQFGDELYDVDAIVDSSFDTQLYKLAYKPSIFNNGRVDVGLSIGISAMRVEAGIEAIGSVGGGPSAGAIERESLTAPVPLLGAHVDVTLYRGLFLRTSYEYFNASHDEYSAQMTDARISLDYIPWKHFGFGVGYNLVSLEAADDEAPAFAFEYQYDGAMAYVSLLF